jgi:hypothetical protein
MVMCRVVEYIFLLFSMRQYYKRLVIRRSATLGNEHWHINGLGPAGETRRIRAVETNTQTRFIQDRMGSRTFHQLSARSILNRTQQRSQSFGRTHQSRSAGVPYSD